MALCQKHLGLTNKGEEREGIHQKQGKYQWITGTSKGLFLKTFIQAFLTFSS